MQQVRPSKVLYIKLGEGGRWEEHCITGGTLRLGYNETRHDLCMAGRWSEVQEDLEQHSKSKAAATNHTNQIRAFYEAGEDVLWVTFWKHSLWWCFSTPTIRLLEDNSKERPVLEGWHRQDLQGKPLLMGQLSGKLLATQGFQGTICSIKEWKYVIDKINGIQPKEVQEAETALSELQNKIEVIIRRLHWKDFELLIDLIFHQAGWQRVSEVGSTMKSLDLDLLSPITDERVGVQVKAEANRSVYESYRDDRLRDMQGFKRFYFAVHTPSPDLQGIEEAVATDVELLLPPKIANLAVQYGLSNWVIERAK